jgi:hypothetical protein
MLLEWYNLLLHHLSAHSITLVAIFIHFYKMYVGVWPLVHLFRFSTYCALLERGHPPSVATTSSTGTKGTTMYIIALTPSKWDRWRDDWVIMQAEVHGHLELPSIALIGYCSS